MEIVFDENDDPQVLEAMRELARTVRRRGDAGPRVNTANKLEIAFSKALTEINSSNEGAAQASGR